MAFAVVEDPEVEFNERLRMELGWGDVAAGLGKVLIGYTVLFVGVSIGVGLLVVAFIGFQADVAKGLKPSNGHWWELYLGLGILKVIGIISMGIIIGGQFKCMLHAAERHGARWFMFMCIACLFLGPAFQVAAGIASWQAIAEIKNHPGKLDAFHFSPLAQRLLLTGFAISMLYPLFFILFLRAVATCLRLAKHALLIDVFLAFATLLAGATMYGLYKHPLGGPPVPPVPALLVAAGWLVVGVLYVGLIAMMRICINMVISRIRSPLEM
jgi:hypothetical protein